jgi:hypothetical protein
MLDGDTLFPYDVFAVTLCGVYTQQPSFGRLIKKRELGVKNG